jgi:hypothetical protein
VAGFLNKSLYLVSNRIIIASGFDVSCSPQNLERRAHERVLSEGQVNIFNLAKNAGTSVDQIERFYARHLPLSAELAKNLQSFGSS